MPYDVLIVGGGPAGLASALTLGRARRRVLLCDDGPPRNAAATHMQNFVTRDGTPPAEFRRLAKEQLTPYTSVELRASRVDAITGERGAFMARFAGGGSATARRVLLCTGLVDEMPDIPVMRQLWGKTVFQCPYCHAWEVQNQRFAYLAASLESLDFALLLRAWTRDVVVLTGGRLVLPHDARARLAQAGVRIDERVIDRLVPDGERLRAIAFDTGEPLPRDVLFVHPRQHQVALVTALQLATDERGLLQVDEARTSAPGIYAAGDLTSHRQAALLSAAAGTQAAAIINHELTTELALAGALD